MPPLHPPATPSFEPVSGSATEGRDTPLKRARRLVGLRERMLVALLAVGLFMGIGMWLLARDSILQSFRRLEDDHTIQNALRAQRLIDERARQLASQAGDWGAWDETYEFVRDLNDAYVQHTLNAESLTRINVHAILYLDESARVRASAGLDAARAALRPLEPALLNRDWRDLSLASAPPDTRHAGVLFIAGQPMLVGAGPILHGDGTGPTRGTLVVLRTLDQRELQSLSERLGFPLALVPPSPLAGPGRSEVQSHDQIAGYFALCDLFGAVVMEGRCSLPRDIMNEGRAAVHNTGVNVIAITAVFALVAFVTLGHFVIARVATMSRAIARLARTLPGPARLPVRGSDEIAALGRSFNNLLEAVETTHAQLLQAKTDAEDAAGSKARFLASMSHEIRTPLNGIIGFADLLRRDADAAPARRREWVEIIHASSVHLLTLLNDVLDLSKMEAGKSEVSVAPRNPRDLVRQASLTLQSRAHERGLTLDVTIHPSVPAAIRTDATRLRQVILNLVSNAVKFTDHGRVLVEADCLPARDEHSAPTLRIGVKDTGIGLSPEQAARLFAPFEQAQPAPGHPHRAPSTRGGTGLGLAISKRLAQRLGGDLLCASMPGEGSVFVVTVAATPLLPGEAPPTDAQQPSAEPDAASLTGRTILVADDVEANRQVCGIFLERAGARVLYARDGREALRTALEHQPDLVLMDVQMPELSGLEAAAALRAGGFHRPILALTALSSTADREACAEAGCNEFLTKPVNPSAMLRSAARWTADAAPPSNSTPVPHTPAGDARTLGAQSPLAGLPELPIDPDVLPVARAWLADLPAQLDAIEAALARGDGVSVARAAHRIKGTGGTLGLPEFSRLGARLEAAAHRPGADARHEAVTALADLRSAHARATSTLPRLEQAA